MAVTGLHVEMYDMIAMTSVYIACIMAILRGFRKQHVMYGLKNTDYFTFYFLLIRSYLLYISGLNQDFICHI